MVCAASSGVWGANRSLNAPKDSTVKDEDLQAQAWLPNCLMVMLEEVRRYTPCQYCPGLLLADIDNQDAASDRTDGALLVRRVSAPVLRC